MADRLDTAALAGIAIGDDGRARCWWADSTPQYQAYHDTEWGFPVADDRRLFEKLCLEGFQAGLSWLTILRKREAFREVFANFEFAEVARFGDDKVAELMNDARIVRNRAKIEATINNAQRALELVEREGSLAHFLWGYEAERPATDPTRADLPVTTPESKALAKEFKRRGWRFVGPTTVYAFMEAMGLVNDHIDGCHCRPTVAAARARFKRP
ncbi:MAG TPA: DNA-3-methyladenine glycosylase I [Solirubrobacteraceae bacterium]|nr:DNA-3-methyladenine glycosylase I [Solirubrobacteraceae bacterium]